MPPMKSTEYATDDCGGVIGWRGRAAPPRDSRTVARKRPKSRRSNGWRCTRLAPSTALNGAEPRSETMPRMAHVGGRRRDDMVKHRAHFTQKTPNCITHSCLGLASTLAPRSTLISQLQYNLDSTYVPLGSKAIRHNSRFHVLSD